MYLQNSYPTAITSGLDLSETNRSTIALEKQEIVNFFVVNIPIYIKQGFNISGSIKEWQDWAKIAKIWVQSRKKQERNEIFFFKKKPISLYFLETVE